MSASTSASRAAAACWSLYRNVAADVDPQSGQARLPVTAVHIPGRKP